MKGGTTTGKKYRIAVLPGDGIGPEVTREAVKVLNRLEIDFEYLYCDVGSVAYAAAGTPLPAETVETCDEADATLLGAVGYSYAPYGIPRIVPIHFRIERNAFANVRPLKLYPGAFAPDDPRSQSRVDAVVIRDINEGFALEHEGYLWAEEGVDTRRVTEAGAQRVIEFAYKYAERESRKRVTCIDAHNLLFSDKVFRRAYQTVSVQYPNLESECISVDVAAMMQTRDPKRFDIIVTSNIFGDIFSGIIIGQIGGVGMAPSACVGNDFAFFEPVHGPAWDIAGKGVANPIGSILSAKMMVDWLGEKESGNTIERAVSGILVDGKVRTRDLGGSSRTWEVGDVISSFIEEDLMMGPVPPETTLLVE